MDVWKRHSFRFKRLTADFDAGVLHGADGRDIALRPQTFAVLEYLSQHPSRIVSKEDLMRAVGGGVVVTEDSLVQCATDIRRALETTTTRLSRQCRNAANS
jgi:DNA-binding winged helix-turn-helix (wHTH) protein